MSAQRITEYSHLLELKELPPSNLPIEDVKRQTQEVKIVSKSYNQCLGTLHFLNWTPTLFPLLTFKAIQSGGNCPTGS